MQGNDGFYYSEVGGCGSCTVSILKSEGLYWIATHHGQKLKACKSAIQRAGNPTLVRHTTIIRWDDESKPELREKSQCGEGKRRFLLVRVVEEEGTSQSRKRLQEDPPTGYCYNLLPTLLPQKIKNIHFLFILINLKHKYNI